MLKQAEQGVGPTPYAIGGERDVRRRAVTAIAPIERVLQAVEAELKGQPRVGRLRLRYHQRSNHFEWRLSEAVRRTSSLSGGLQDEQLRRLRPSTRAKVESVRRLLGVRAAAIAVLRLTEWALTHGEKWSEQTVTLRWSSGEFRRAIWGAMLSGGIMKRGGVRPLDGMESGHVALVQSLNVGTEPQGWRGEATEGVKCVVEEMRRIDEQLEDMQRQLRGGVRVYYCEKLDSWMLRQLIGPRLSRHLSDESGRRVLNKVREQERGVVEKVLDGIERRKRLKRVLHLVAIMGEAAQQWPGGHWQLRGERGAGQAAAWVASATERGMSVIERGVAVGHGNRV